MPLLWAAVRFVAARFRRQRPTRSPLRLWAWKVELALPLAARAVKAMICPLAIAGGHGTAVMVVLESYPASSIATLFEKCFIYASTCRQIAGSTFIRRRA